MGALELTLKGNIAIITGAGSGIGEATARLLAKAGAAVIVADIDESRAKRVANDIELDGGTSLAVQVDVSDEPMVSRLISQTAKAFGRLDVLVNNASWVYPTMEKAFLEMPLDEWDRTQAVNFRGVVLCCRAALPLLEANRGNIVNITSVNAQIIANGAAYCASKAAVAHLTHSLALEYARRGVRVNAIAPGWIDTPGVLFSTRGPKAEAAVDQLIPMGRLGRPEEIAHAVAFLASDVFSSYITGSTVLVDGGWVLR